MKKNVFIALLAVMLVCCGCGKGITEITGTSENLDSVMTKLAVYEGVSVDADVMEFTEDEFEKELSKADGELKEIEDRTKIEDGDVVNIDFTGLMDGEEFDNGSYAGYDLTIGSDSFIEGFEEGLIGKELGGTYDLELQFPEDYQNDTSLAGKDVVFRVTVNKIQIRLEPDPEKIRQQMRDDRLGDWLIRHIVDKSSFRMDKEEVEVKTQEMMEQYKSIASLIGGMDVLLEFRGQTESEFEKECKQSSRYYIQERLVADEIARLEGLATDEEIRSGRLEDGTTTVVDVVKAYLVGQAVVK